MTVRNLFIFNAIICILFALPLIFAPQILADMYTVEKTIIDGGIAVIVRAYGSLMLALGIALWFSRNAKPSIGRRGLLILILVANIPLVINYLHGILTGIEKNEAWGIVILTTVLAAWAGLLLSKEVNLTD
jgi:hypothetical protein